MKRVTLILALILALCWCAPASAATWSQPDITTLAGSLVSGDGDWLELPWTVVWQLGPVVPGSPLDPRAVERLANGNTLVASRDSLGVYEVSAAGAVVWSYTRANDDPLLTPFHATRTPTGTTLIVDRWQETVIEVDQSGSVIWRYGVPEHPDQQADNDHLAPAPGELVDPFHAVRLPNGNTLIAENQAGRVIEVRSSDYRAGQPNHGYTSSSIVWQYGEFGEMARDHAYAPGYLDWPKYAVRTPEGTTLIADEVGNRVVEVTQGGAVVWSYGVPGVPGDSPGFLNQPAAAERLSDGTTLIADGRNDRVIRVMPDGEIIWEFSADSLLGLDDVGLAGPRRAVVTATGSILIADEGNDRLVELGRQPSGTATSAPLDCGLPGARKRFSSISVTAETPGGTAARVSYSVDGGRWTALAGSALPPDTFGTLIRFRVTLETTRLDTTPRLLGVSLGYEAAPAQPPVDPRDGAGSGGTTSGNGESAATGGGATSRPRPRSTPRGSSAPAASGTKRSGGGLGAGGPVTIEGPLEGTLSSQRGWAMASTRIGGIDRGRPGPGAPAPSLGGLALLGALYTLGAASVPAHRVTARLMHRLRPTG